MRKKKKKINIVPYLFIAPNFIGFLVFILIPVLASLIVSFTDFNIYKGFDGTQFVGLKNFADMFRDKWFQAALTNNVIYTLVTIPVLLGGSILLANILMIKYIVRLQFGLWYLCLIFQVLLQFLQSGC